MSETRNEGGSRKAWQASLPHDEKNDGNIWVIATGLFAVIAILLFGGLMSANSELVMVKTQLQQSQDNNVAALCAPLPNNSMWTNRFYFDCPDGNTTAWEQLRMDIMPNLTQNGSYRIGDG